MIKSDSKLGSVTIKVSKDNKSVAVFFQSGESRLPRTLGWKQIAEFPIEVVWDMLRDAVAITDVGFDFNPELFRRKGEAAAAILHTNTLILKEKI